MSYITKLLRGADARPFETLEAQPDEVMEHLKARAQEIAANPAPNYRAVEPAPMIVRVAETYLKANDNYVAAEKDLTRRIDELVEERRQMRAAITSTVNGLYPIHDDPALPDEMKKRIVATFNNEVRVAIDLNEIDLT
jgi:hypothetical protein